MSSGPSRAKALKPDDFFRFIEKLLDTSYVEDEVFIRRAVSALYLALFNYWAACRFEEGRRGRSPYQDCFRYSEFHADLLKKRLDHYLIVLLTYRVAADHYALNPTIIEVYDRGIVDKIGKRFKVELNDQSLELATKVAWEILKNI